MRVEARKWVLKKPLNMFYLTYMPNYLLFIRRICHNCDETNIIIVVALFMYVSNLPPHDTIVQWQVIRWLIQHMLKQRNSYNYVGFDCDRVYHSY